jgi:hypothetical protein
MQVEAVLKYKIFRLGFGTGMPGIEALNFADQLEDCQRYSCLRPPTEEHPSLLASCGG